MKLFYIEIYDLLCAKVELIILLITILSILVTIQLITRNIVSSLNIFQNGLLSFFAFSNKESSNVELITQLSHIKPNCFLV